MIITIDGPAGSGKSAAALELARKLGIPHLDTGAMYRAIALHALESGILDDPDAIAERARNLTLGFDWSRSPSPILLNGRDVSDAVRRPEVTEITYVAADNPWVREELVNQQRRIGQLSGSLVTEGRDQGTIVFPHADFKFYVNAHPEERARRRVAQLAAKGMPFDQEEILDQILQRDQRDQVRPVGPLARPNGAIEIDTTHLTLQGVVESMIRTIMKKDVATPTGAAAS